MPTLNQFENSGDVRATVLIFEATRVNDVRVNEDRCPTVATYWGTGGARVPYTNASGYIRRLTPTECERLQGFSEIEKSAIFEVCFDPQKNYATAEILSLRWRSLVGSAGNRALRERVPSVERVLHTNDPQRSKPVLRIARTNYEDVGVELHSQGKLLWSVSYAGSQNSLVLPIRTEDFAHGIVRLLGIAERITSGGKVGLQKGGTSSVPAESGKPLEKSSGSETMLPANDVSIDSTIQPNRTMSITSFLTDSPSLESSLRTSFSFVINAIIGFIPQEILSESSFIFQIDSVEGWTADQADSHRYKQMGNAVCVNVVDFIVERLVAFHNG